LNIKTMNIKTMAQRTLGLLALLILLAVEAVTLWIIPVDALLAHNLVSTALNAVACIVAGYFLRTFWALLIVPLVYWGGAYLVGFLNSYPVSADRTPESFVRGAVFLIANEAIIIAVSSIITALLTLLGVLLGKRSARKRSAHAGAAFAAS
jgi:hypothetical protein